MGENGGDNLYGICDNNVIDCYDVFGFHKIKVRIDVPGQNPKSPKEHSNYFNRVIKDKTLGLDQGHAWLCFDAEDGKNNLEIGFYPQKRPDATEYENGVIGTLKDDHNKHYEYEYVIDVSECQYKEALKIASTYTAKNPFWGASKNCVDFVTDVLKESNIETITTKPVKVDIAGVMSVALSHYPGQMAMDLFNQKKGKYVVGGDVGNTGKFEFVDTHISPSLSDSDLKDLEKYRQEKKYPPTPAAASGVGKKAPREKIYVPSTNPLMGI